MAESGVVVPYALPWPKRLAAATVAALFWLCRKTWRVRWRDSSGPPTSGHVIFCIWHNRFMAALASYDTVARKRWQAKGLAAIISASRDGSLVSDVAARLGVQPIRGSTSRRGPQALLEATTWVDRDYNIAFFSDGPRGPVYEVKEGIIALAKITGRPIVPVSNFTNWKIRLGSWDRFQIPLPFARCDAYFGEPIWVPRDASDAEREQLREKLEKSMRAITKD